MNASRLKLIEEMAALTKILSKNTKHQWVEVRMARVFAQISICATDDKLNITQIERKASEFYEEEKQRRTT